MVDNALVAKNLSMVAKNLSMVAKVPEPFLEPQEPNHNIL